MVFLALIFVPAVIFGPAERWGSVSVGLVVALSFELVLLSIARRRVVVTLDERTSTLILSSTRWPLAARTHQVPVADVQDVVVQKSPNSTAVRIALVLSHDRELPVTSSYFGDLGHMQRDAAAIRALCGIAPQR